MPDINPYKSPLEMNEWEPEAIPPKMAKVARNIRAICILYIVFGCIGMLAGVGIAVNPKEAEMPTVVGIIISVAGCAGIISATGVLRKCSWGVPVCMIVSALYLLSFPVGTILGGYFLFNIGKVKKMFC